MVNKDMNGFPVKKCSAFQFFKKRVRRWIKSPMVSVDKHQSPSLKYTGPSVVHIPPGEPDFEPSLCQTCLGDHAFQKGVLPQEKESCSWETQSGCEVKEPCNHANILTKPDPRTFWTNDDSEKRWKRNSSPGGPYKVPVHLTETNNPKENKRQRKENGK
ncbi:Signal Recognition Particle Subunit Srp68 [Manis pentadactyla]|nr:Signal Recognition Particle Subunit Srp68 [Manis pentadactyla]